MTDCALCGETDLDMGRRYGGVNLCRECYRFVEENDGENGRLRVERCPTCKHVKGARFVKYKKRGRPVGSKNAPKPRPEAKLTTYTDGGSP